MARKAENISIIGRGRIDGNGDSFFNLKSFHNTPDFDAKYTRQGADYDAPQYGTEFGPVDTLPAGRSTTMTILSDCRNVLVRDVTLSNAPNWTLHVQGSDNIAINSIHIQNNVLIPNNDGIDCMRSKHLITISYPGLGLMSPQIPHCQRAAQAAVANLQACQDRSNGRVRRKALSRFD